MHTQHNKPLAPQVKLIGRGPSRVSTAHHWVLTRNFFKVSRAQNELHQEAIIPWEFYLVLRKKLNTIAV